MLGRLILLEVTKLQWGRDEGVAEEVRIERGDQCGENMLQWGRDEGVAEETKVWYEIMGTQSASMGPRRGCRGREAQRENARRRGRGFNGAATRVSRKRSVATARGPASRRFNGAATRVSRKRPRSDIRPSRRCSLQWGRDEGVAEEDQDDGMAFPRKAL